MTAPAVGERHPWRAIVSASLALTVATLPGFLIGASSDAIRRDLGVSETAIGAAVTVMFVTAALIAAPAGRVSDRIGGARALRIGVAAAGLATAAVGIFVGAWWHLVLPLVIVGVAVGLIDTGAAHVFAARVDLRRQGTAFGLKEACVPGASLLAGLALPTLAATWGWRVPFVAALTVAAAVFLALPRPRRGGVPVDPAAPVAPTGVDAPADTIPGDPVSGADRGHGGTASLVRFAAGAGLGTAAGAAASTFLVPALTALDMATGVAGVVLSAASVVSIGVRLGGGRWADRPAAVPARAVAGLLLAGAVGAALLATSGTSSLRAVVGAVVVIGLGWGWTGLAFLAAVRSRPATPAAAAGIVLTGLGTGGAIGPLAFGALVSSASYPVAWTVTGGALLLGAGLAASGPMQALADA